MMNQWGFPGDGMSSLLDAVLEWSIRKQEHAPEWSRRPRDTDVDGVQEILERLLARTGASAEEALALAEMVAVVVLRGLLEAGRLPVEQAGVIAAAASTAWLDGLGTGLHYRGSAEDWIVSPGETLRQWREDRNLSLETTAIMCFLEEERYGRIEAGGEPITEDVAVCLSIGTGIKGRFWLALEKVYRDSEGFKRVS